MVSNISFVQSPMSSTPGRLWSAHPLLPLTGGTLLEDFSSRDQALRSIALSRAERFSRHTKISRQPLESAASTSTKKSRRTATLDQRCRKTSVADNIKSIRAYVTELKERVDKLNIKGGISSARCWSWNPTTLAFKKQRMQIIELWDVCQVSIIHRTCTSEETLPTLEVEFRRLLWVQEEFAKNDSD
ncbi:hypothetical protein SELMODRAFT_426545 [Selaginella moellendorffii]|uniref:NPK1-activating kinesin-like protein C-terminal domain-containing protein n=1 Tax=Selaginella moellendorffii TaxID=88036 RepID=D8SWQ3_SELML|nr:hypothetical protein SELMODRAFT_426545 [Selaginella moellendorffii]